jgi:hypothetical protein
LTPPLLLHGKGNFVNVVIQIQTANVISVLQAIGVQNVKCALVERVKELVLVMVRARLVLLAMVRVSVM